MMLMWGRRPPRLGQEPTTADRRARSRPAGGPRPRAGAPAGSAGRPARAPAPSCRAVQIALEPVNRPLRACCGHHEVALLAELRLPPALLRVVAGMFRALQLEKEAVIRAPGNRQTQVRHPAL